MNSIIQAIEKGETKKIEMMLRNDPVLAKTRTDTGISLLLYSLYHQKKDIATLIRASCDSLDFFEAAAMGDLFELQRNIDDETTGIDDYSPDGFTALGFACFFGRIETIVHLIVAGADVNKVANNDFRVAPIHSAVAIQNMEIIQLLLDNGADVNACQANNITPLHSAANYGNKNLVLLLLQREADINIKTNDGKTAADMAREAGYNELAAILDT